MLTVWASIDFCLPTCIIFCEAPMHVARLKGSFIVARYRWSTKWSVGSVKTSEMKQRYFFYLSQYLTNLMHKICFTISFISCLNMFRAHLLLIRRSKLHYTASGIITPIGGRLVKFWPPDDEHMCSKHVEAWNKTYCKTNFLHKVG